MSAERIQALRDFQERFVNRLAHEAGLALHMDYTEYVRTHGAGDEPDSEEGHRPDERGETGDETPQRERDEDGCLPELRAKTGHVSWSAPVGKTVSSVPRLRSERRPIPVREAARATTFIIDLSIGRNYQGRTCRLT